MLLKKSFHIQTDINKGHEAINALACLGSILKDDYEKQKLAEIDKFVQSIWSQMTAQQFPEGINAETTVTAE